MSVVGVTVFGSIIFNNEAALLFLIPLLFDFNLDNKIYILLSNQTQINTGIKIKEKRDEFIYHRKCTGICRTG